MHWLSDHNYRSMHFLLLSVNDGSWETRSDLGVRVKDGPHMVIDKPPACTAQ
jgi:hypothetical protein